MPFGGRRSVGDSWRFYRDLRLKILDGHFRLLADTFGKTTAAATSATDVCLWMYRTQFQRTASDSAVRRFSRAVTRVG